MGGRALATGGTGGRGYGQVTWSNLRQVMKWPGLQVVVAMVK